MFIKEHLNSEITGIIKREERLNEKLRHSKIETELKKTNSMLKYEQDLAFAHLTSKIGDAECSKKNIKRVSEEKLYILFKQISTLHGSISEVKSKLELVFIKSNNRLKEVNKGTIEIKVLKNKVREKDLKLAF